MEAISTYYRHSDGKRKSKKIMTRKTALLKAIQIVKKSSESKEEIQDIVLALELCYRELPFTKWTKEAIFDACDQYCLEKERTYLISSDFQSASLPSHPVIKKRFGMTAKEFRDLYYPINKNPMSRKGIHLRYNKKTEEEYLNEFIKQYSIIQPKSAEEYNKSKNDDMPGTQSLQRMAGVSSWGKLLEKYDLKTKKIKQIEVKYSGSTALHSLKQKAGHNAIKDVSI